MIDKLFSMHNIKYIISVDDCFLTYNEAEMRIRVSGEMCFSLEPFRAVLLSAGYAEAVETIDTFNNIGADSTQAVQRVVEGLDFESLQKCCDICEEHGMQYAREKDTIIGFLEKLKEDRIINDYKTFPSTKLANDFNTQNAGMTEGGILWLLDRNFSRVGEAEDAGLTFAENIIERGNLDKNYIYILSAIDSGASITEDDIEEEFDKILLDKSKIKEQSFIYYISKTKLSSNDDRIAKSIAQGFKRKACYELFQLFNECLKSSLSEATENVKNIRQKILNYLFESQASERGEPFIEVAARLVQILQQDAYNKAVAEYHTQIAERVRYYEKLCAAVTGTSGNKKKLKEGLKEYRNIELYNKHINAQQCEITTGDIFKIESSFFLLVSQACDTCLRKDGHRTLDYATLLEIQDIEKNIGLSYPLSCFMDMKKPAVIYRSLRTIPFDILDLCVFNTKGHASIELKEKEAFSEELELFTENYRNRFCKVLTTIKQVQDDKNKVESFFSDTHDDSEVSVEKVKAAYMNLNKLMPDLKNFNLEGMTVSFPVQRIERLNEITTIDIVKEYGRALSRIGHPFDFLGDASGED